MTLHSALKVARGACVKLAFHLEEIGADEGSIAEIEEAAAVLARLEAELPKLLKDAGGYLPYAADVLPDLGESDHVRGMVQRIDDLIYGTNLSRLDAAPKEGS